ncbi:MAG: substrate-binding domain-containing protein [Rectinemataceae bacterium]
MKRAAWILAIVFGLAFLGATLLNADLISKSRQALASGVFRDPEAAETARFHVIVVIPDTGDSFFDGLLEGISDSASEADAAVQVFRYPGPSAAEAERYFEIALRAKADGLIMYVTRDEDVDARAARAAREGVTFIPVGANAPGRSIPGFIGSDPFLQGFEGGKLICARLGAQARIGVILPASETGTAEEEPLYRGVEAAVRAFPGASIEIAAWERPGVLAGEEAAVLILQSRRTVNALFCSSSRSTMGAAQVVVDMNKVGEILIVGADETAEIGRYIDKGVVVASIVRDSRRIGREAVRAFSLAKESGQPPIPVEVGFFVKTAKGANE